MVPVHRHAALFPQSPFQRPLQNALRKDQQEREGASGRDQLDLRATGLAVVEGHAFDPPPRLQKGINDPQMTQQFNHPRMQGTRIAARRGARFPVENPHLDARLGQEQRREQPNRTGSDHYHFSLILSHAMKGLWATNCFPPQAGRA